MSVRYCRRPGYSGVHMGLLDGKAAIVTGAGRGIGREEALLLASEGAAVVVNDLGGRSEGGGTDETAAQAVVAEIVATGGRATANAADVADWDQAGAMIDQAVEEFGGLDILINNAGILRDRMSFNLDQADWDSVVNVHLNGHFYPSRHAAAHWRARMKEAGAPVDAAIVNTTSESGLYGNAGQANYAAAKAGIASLTIVLARELERIGVRVNAVAPAARTRLTEELAGDYMSAEEGKFDAFDPQNVAPAVVWLASPLAEGVSGQVLKVQGGQIQALEGWRPRIEITSDHPWSIDDIEANRAVLFPDGAEIPPFFFTID